MKPKDILPDDEDSREIDGVNVRKGSVGAFIANVKIIQSSDRPETDKAQAKADLISLIPALEKLGLFELFEVRDPEIRSLVRSSLARK